MSSGVGSGSSARPCSASNGSLELVVRRAAFRGRAAARGPARGRGPAPRATRVRASGMSSSAASWASLSTLERAQRLDLRARDAGHVAEVVVVAPPLLALRPPRAVVAVRDQLRDRSHPAARGSRRCRARAGGSRRRSRRRDSVSGSKSVPGVTTCMWRARALDLARAGTSTRRAAGSCRPSFRGRAWCRRPRRTRRPGCSVCSPCSRKSARPDQAPSSSAAW